MDIKAMMILMLMLLMMYVVRVDDMCQPLEALSPWLCSSMTARVLTNTIMMMCHQNLNGDLF